jgi:hypothetical protein
LTRCKSNDRLAFMLHLGLFENFKSEAQIVLCSGNSKDMEFLFLLVTSLYSGDQKLIPLHNEAFVAPNHPVKLFAARSLPKKQTAGEFVWLCSGEAGLDIPGMIKPLMAGLAGHQYFELAEGKGTLMISVNEYNDEWWASHG